MSKLYNKYIYLKKQNNSILYLFKSGIFYIFLDDDAKKVSSILGFKLTNLNENIVKCGFPTNNLNKYLEIFKNLNLEVQIVETLDSKPVSANISILNETTKNFIYELSNLDSNSLSIKEAYNAIDDISKKAKFIINIIKRR